MPNICKILFVLSLQLAVVVTLGQNLKEIEGLERDLKSETDHFKKADILLELGKTKGIAFLNSALTDVDRAQTIYENLSNHKGQLQALKLKANLLISSGQSSKAKIYAQSAYDLASKNNFLEEKIRALHLLSKTFPRQYGSSEAQKYLEQALESAKLLRKQSLIVRSYIMLGDYHNDRKSFNTAESYYKVAISEAKISSDLLLEAESLKALAYCKLSLKDDAGAIKFFVSSLRIYEDNNDKLNQAEICYELGLLHNKLDNDEDGLLYLKNSLLLATSISNKEYLSKGNSALANIYESKGDFENAYNYLKFVSSVKGVSEINELEAQLRAQAKEQENQRLNEQNKHLEEDKENSKINSMIFFAIMLLIAVLAMYLFYINNQRKKINNELRVSKDKAEESEKEKERFLTYTSHEIRTPLHAVVGVSQLLERTSLDNKQRGYINTIKGSANNILHIVNDVLDLSKVESGNLSLEKVSVSLKELTDSILHTLQFKVMSNEVELINEYDSDIPDFVKADPVRLNQILLNLADNAVKFTSKGKVIIRTKLLKTDGAKIGVIFEVEDTGKGIRKSALSTIFNRYEQETIHTTRNYGGTGLGLPITKQLIELMDGELIVESKFGEGTKFSFHLEMEVDKAEKIKAGVPTKSLKDISLLYVDDNALNRELFYDLVSDKSRSISVDLAESGSIGMRKIEESNYDIILLDLQMPGMDGYKVVELIRSKLIINKQNLPVIAVSAHVSEGIRDKCLKAGFNDYISKPIEVAALTNCLSKYIDIVEVNRTKRSIDNLEHNDLSVLINLVGDNPSKMQKYMDLTISHMPKDLEELNTYLDHEDWEMIGNIAHKMKGNAGYLGMNKVLVLLDELEKLKEEIGDYAKIADIVKRLNHETGLAISEIETLKL